MHLLNKFLTNIQKLRLEELIAVLFLIPSLLITLKANWYFIDAGMNIPRKFYGGITRLVVTSLVMVLFFYFVKKKPAPMRWCSCRSARIP